VAGQFGTFGRLWPAIATAVCSRLDARRETRRRPKAAEAPKGDTVRAEVGKPDPGRARPDPGQEIP